NLHSATPSPQFEGFSGARRFYQCPGTTRMVWKFQPPSGKDSQKRSATRHKNPQSRAQLRTKNHFLWPRIVSQRNPSKAANDPWTRKSLTESTKPPSCRNSQEAAV